MDGLKLIIAIVIFAIVLVLFYWLGELLLGREREGGKRFVLLGMGLVLSFVSRQIFLDFGSAFMTGSFPYFLGVPVAGLIFLIGISAIGLAILGSNKRVQSFFHWFLP